MNIKLTGLRLLKLIIYTIVWIIGLAVVIGISSILTKNLHLDKTVRLYLGIIPIGGYVILTTYILSKMGKVWSIIYYVCWIISLPIILDSVHAYCMTHNLRGYANDTRVVATFIIYTLLTTILPIILFPNKNTMNRLSNTPWVHKKYQKEPRTVSYYISNAIKLPFLLTFYIFWGIGQIIVLLPRFLFLIFASAFSVIEFVFAAIASIIGWGIAISFAILVISLIVETCSR